MSASVASTKRRPIAPNFATDATRPDRYRVLLASDVPVQQPQRSHHMAIVHQVHLTANNTPVNGPSKTGNPSGNGRGNNPSKK